MVRYYGLHELQNRKNTFSEEWLNYAVNEIKELNWYFTRKGINLPNLQQLVNNFHSRTNFTVSSLGAMCKKRTPKHLYSRNKTILSFYARYTV